jgi:hypothetical protein
MGPAVRSGRSERVETAAFGHNSLCELRSRVRSLWDHR